MKKKILKYLKKYQKKLKLSKWKIILIYDDTITSFAETSFTKLNTAEIRINLSKNIKEDELIDTIKHELLHIFLSTYTDYVETGFKYLYQNPEQIKEIDWSKEWERLIRREEKVVGSLAKIID